MTVIQRSALLPHPAEAMFELVTDIEAYPRYMDGCVGAEILRRGEAMVEARLDLSRGGISHSFATRNTMRPHDRIELELLEGPFDRFTGLWQFQRLDAGACKVSLDLEFTLRSKVLGAAAARLFESVTVNLVDALGKRADQLYG